MQTDDIVVVTSEDPASYFRVGVVTDKTVHGSFRVHFGNLFDYWPPEQLRLATAEEQPTALAPVNPSSRVGFH